MLLPSALSCDSSQPSQPRLQPSLFSPPASPPTLSSQNALANIMTTCRNLQSLLAPPAPIVSEERPTLAQLPTPPLAHAPPPLKLRLRSRGKVEHREDPLAPRKRITKRAPPRGLNKRRRAADDDMGRHDSDSDMQDSDFETESVDSHQPADELVAPATPKRARIAPEQLPLGLERSDFHEVYQRASGDANNTHTHEEEVDGADGDEWSAEDDRILVELILEKLKLSKTEWQDCARNLGRDRHAVSRRWKSLMLGGDVGLKTRSRRTRLHSTWR